MNCLFLSVMYSSKISAHTLHMSQTPYPTRENKEENNANAAPLNFNSALLTPLTPTNMSQQSNLQQQQVIQRKRTHHRRYTDDFKNNPVKRNLMHAFNRLP